MEKNSFTLVDENGQEKVYDVLFTFDSDETGKSYIVYTDNSTDEKGNVIIRANTYDPSGEDLREEMSKEGSNNEEDGNASN